jgi:hypothetical protein
MEKAEAREKERLKAEERKVGSGPAFSFMACSLSVAIATQEGGHLQEHAEECRSTSAG